MLINYSLCGNIRINNEPIKSNYVVKNLNTGFISNTYETDIGYYSINLSNFPNKTFNKNDIIVIYFFIRHNGIDYKAYMYNIINPAKDIQIMNVNMSSNWNYSSVIQITANNNKRTIRFLTYEYEHILFKLYIKYNGIYKEIDSALISQQILNLEFNHNGEFKIVGYVVDGNKLLTYSEKEFTVTEVSSERKQIRYIEWE